MTTSGTVTDYDIGYPTGATDFTISSLTTGSDGNVWFNGRTSGGIYAGRLNVSTGVVTFYASPIPSYDYPGALVAGSDGNLYYYLKSAYAQNYSYLVYVNPSSGTTTTSHTFDSYSNLTSIASDTAGNIWVTDNFYGTISNYPVVGSTGGGYYVLPSSVTSTGSLTYGADGNLWFTANSQFYKLSPTGSFTSYSYGSGVSPSWLAAGPDGALWFLDTGSVKKIGRITTNGNINEYTIPGTSVGASGIVLGPNNAMWFGYSDGTTAKLASITTDPFFDSYPVSSTYNTSSLITAAGGSIWYVEASKTSPYPNHYIGSMTTGGVVADYDTGMPTGATSFTIASLTTGTDGNVWFNGKSNTGTIYAGRLNISTGITTFYACPIPSYSYPGSIVAGTDGNLYYYLKSAYAQNYSYLVYVNPTSGTTTTASSFDNYSNLTSIASDPTGKIWITDTFYKTVTYTPVVGGTGGGYYRLPTSVSYTGSLTYGADGNLWFTANGQFYKLTPSGTFTPYSIPSGVSPGWLAAGPDGGVWFSDTGSVKKIGRITTTGTITEYAIPGTAGSTGLILGPDNAVWFSTSGNIGRLGY